MERKNNEQIVAAQRATYDTETDSAPMQAVLVNDFHAIIHDNELMQESPDNDTFSHAENSVLPGIVRTIQTSKTQPLTTKMTTSRGGAVETIELGSPMRNDGALQLSETRPIEKPSSKQQSFAKNAFSPNCKISIEENFDSRPDNLTSLSCNLKKNQKSNADELNRSSEIKMDSEDLMPQRPALVIQPSARKQMLAKSNANTAADTQRSAEFVSITIERDQISRPADAAGKMQKNNKGKTKGPKDESRVVISTVSQSHPYPVLRKGLTSQSSQRSIHSRQRGQSSHGRLLAKMSVTGNQLQPVISLPQTTTTNLHSSPMNPICAATNNTGMTATPLHMGKEGEPHPKNLSNISATDFDPEFILQQTQNQFVNMLKMDDREISKQSSPDRKPLLKSNYKSTALKQARLVSADKDDHLSSQADLTLDYSNVQLQSKNDNTVGQNELIYDAAAEGQFTDDDCLKLLMTDGTKPKKQQPKTPRTRPLPNARKMRLMLLKQSLTPMTVAAAQAKAIMFAKICQETQKEVPIAATGHTSEPIDVRKIIGKAKLARERQQAEKLPESSIMASNQLGGPSSLMGREVAASILPEDVEVCDRAISAHEATDSAHAGTRDALSGVISPCKIDMEGELPPVGSLSRIQYAEEHSNSNIGFQTLRFQGEDGEKQSPSTAQIIPVSDEKSQKTPKVEINGTTVTNMQIQEIKSQSADEASDKIAIMQVARGYRSSTDSVDGTIPPIHHLHGEDDRKIIKTNVDRSLSSKQITTFGRPSIADKPSTNKRMSMAEKCLIATPDNQSQMRKMQQSRNRIQGTKSQAGAAKTSGPQAKNLKVETSGNISMGTIEISAQSKSGEQLIQVFKGKQRRSQFGNTGEITQKTVHNSELRIYEEETQKIMDAMVNYARSHNSNETSTMNMNAKFRHEDNPTADRGTQMSTMSKNNTAAQDNSLLMGLKVKGQRLTSLNNSGGSPGKKKRPKQAESMVQSLRSLHTSGDQSMLPLHQFLPFGQQQLAAATQSASTMMITSHRLIPAKQVERQQKQQQSRFASNKFNKNLQDLYTARAHERAFMNSIENVMGVSSLMASQNLSQQHLQHIVIEPNPKEVDSVIPIAGSNYRARQNAAQHSQEGLVSQKSHETQRDCFHQTVTESRGDSCKQTHRENMAPGRRVLSVAFKSSRERRKPETGFGTAYRKPAQIGLNNDLESDGSMIKSLKSDSVGRRLKIHLNMQKKQTKNSISGQAQKSEIQAEKAFNYQSTMHVGKQNRDENKKFSLQPRHVSAHISRSKQPKTSDNTRNVQRSSDDPTINQVNVPDINTSFSEAPPFQKLMSKERLLDHEEMFNMDQTVGMAERLNGDSVSILEDEAEGVQRSIKPDIAIDTQQNSARLFENIMRDDAVVITEDMKPTIKVNMRGPQYMANTTDQTPRLRTAPHLNMLGQMQKSRNRVVQSLTSAGVRSRITTHRPISKRFQCNQSSLQNQMMMENSDSEATRSQKRIWQVKETLYKSQVFYQSHLNERNCVHFKKAVNPPDKLVPGSDRFPPGAIPLGQPSQSHKQVSKMALCNELMRKQEMFNLRPKLRHADVELCASKFDTVGPQLTENVGPLSRSRLMHMSKSQRQLQRCQQRYMSETAGIAPQVKKSPQTARAGKVIPKPQWRNNNLNMMQVYESFKSLKSPLMLMRDTFKTSRAAVRDNIVLSLVARPINYQKSEENLKNGSVDDGSAPTGQTATVIPTNARESQMAPLGAGDLECGSNHQVSHQRPIFYGYEQTPSYVRSENTRIRNLEQSADLSLYDDTKIAGEALEVTGDSKATVLRSRGAPGC